MPIEFHEAADIFPLDAENIGELAKDIRANGLQVPIELLDGKIIDGRRRYQACEKAGVKPSFRSVSPADPVAYVLSLNLHRRQLTPSQRAMVGQRAREFYDEQAKLRQKQGRVKLPDPSSAGHARDQAGKAVGVSGKMIDYAAKVQREGCPDLVAAVDEGRLSVSSAAKITDEPEVVQHEVANQARFSGGRYRKPQVENVIPENESNGCRKGIGVIRANEAINCLIRIPKNDALRKRGFQIVTDWIKANS